MTFREYLNEAKGLEANIKKGIKKALAGIPIDKYTVKETGKSASKIKNKVIERALADILLVVNKDANKYNELESKDSEYFYNLFRWNDIRSENGYATVRYSLGEFRNKQDFITLY